MTAKRKRIDGNAFDCPISFEKLYLKSRWSDVHFLLKSNEGTFERVPAHKMLLANESDVFAAKFYGELREKGDITVADTSIDAFKEFLQCFYLNHVDLTAANVAEVLKLGHEYNVTKCVNACVRFLKDSSNVDNIWFGLGLAILYNQPELQKFCETYIAVHSEDVFKSKHFLKCEKRILAHILQMNLLFCSETVIFEACMSWIKAKSKQNVVTKKLIQEHLGELFYEIRFTSMTIEEFGALSMAHDYAFTFGEHKDIIHTIASSKTSSALFNGNPRQIRWNEKAIAVCDRKMATSNVQSLFVSNNKSTIFESNQAIVLGTMIFAPTDSDLSIDVTIVEKSHVSNDADGSNRILSNFKINLPTRKETTITLPAPVAVRPGFYYEISPKPQQSIRFEMFNCKYLMAEVQMGNNTNIKFHGDRLVGNDLVNLITAFGFNRI